MFKAKLSFCLGSLLKKQKFKKAAKEWINDKMFWFRNIFFGLEIASYGHKHFRETNNCFCKGSTAYAMLKRNDHLRKMLFPALCQRLVARLCLYFDSELGDTLNFIILSTIFTVSAMPCMSLNVQHFASCPTFCFTFVHSYGHFQQMP